MQGIEEERKTPPKYNFNNSNSKKVDSFNKKDESHKHKKKRRKLKESNLKNSLNSSEG